MLRNDKCYEIREKDEENKKSVVVENHSEKMTSELASYVITSSYLSGFMGSSLQSRRNIQRCPQIFWLTRSASAIIGLRQVCFTTWKYYSCSHQYSLGACGALLCSNYCKELCDKFFKINSYQTRVGKSIHRNKIRIKSRYMEGLNEIQNVQLLVTFQPKQIFLMPM